ncbi:amidohydrolase family protein [Desulfallas thermosapovorans]|uniref:Imidazolonepropionase-like amidohydrolase n=1 Tax=Desulfallas thermosapovorans DSM 6562 TaxID=1121431 RepID=A0A5S4ZPI4_9FIRM|nr:amidohydrolase family protein [Desulfallas thermosapovorans]TYO94609.1 imidazolonepropionase-like amidohydrolase [Desulfallas thermosapovorans DSM 6562]
MQLIKIDKTQNYIINTGTIAGDMEGTSGGPTNPGPLSIYLEEGRIAAITGTKDDPYRFKQPNRQTTFLDLGSLTILPPLADCHVHLALDGLDFATARRRWEQPGELHTQISTQLWDTVRHGILAVRDGGDRPGIALRYRELVASGELTGPVIRASGWALRKPRKYGSFLGRGVPAEMLDSALGQLARHGVDQIKVLVSGVVSFKEYSRVGPVQYTYEELSAIVQGARNLGLGVMAHASSDEAVALAVKAGVNTVEHGYFLSRDTLKLMAEKQVAWIPTVVPVAAQLTSLHPAPNQDNYVIAKTVDRQLAMINEARNLGVTLGVGTDSGASGVRHGYSYRQELALYRQAGLTPEEIIRCATINSARVLGLNWGRIAPGNPAAMIAVSGDPLGDINNLRNIEYVFQPV